MSEPLFVDARVVIPAAAIRVTAVRASGPGGQNVNKVASKVDVRVDLGAISGMDVGARARLSARTRNMLDAEGWLRVTSQRTRDRERNLVDAFEKIRALVAEALIAPISRVATRPTRASIHRRLGDKRRLGMQKRTRRSSHDDSY